MNTMIEADWDRIRELVQAMLDGLRDGASEQCSLQEIELALCTLHRHIVRCSIEGEKE